MNEAELRDTLGQIQAIVSAETGSRLSPEGEASLGKILRNIASHNPSGKEGFATRDATILLADLRGFTSISANYPAATVVKLVNRCLITMSEMVFRHQGTIDKFMGDAILVVFEEQGSTDDPVKRAVQCAVDLQLAMDELNSHYKQWGLPELFLGIGINTGPVLQGTLGSDLYATYTVMGDDVNLAARIEAFSLRGQVLVSEATYERCRDFVTTSEPLSVQIKGKKDSIMVREVLEIPSLGKSVPRREIRRSPRVKVTMPFSYQFVHTDVAEPQSHRGVILDIGYHGILATLDQPSAPLTEVKLEFDLSLIGHKAKDIYARTLKVAKSDKGYLCGMEFTSVSADDSRAIQRLVQQLIQGSDPT